MMGGVFIMRVNGFLDMQMIQLHHGDCLEILKQIPDNSVDLVLADPPYAVLQLKWDKLIDPEKLWQELNRITKEDGVVALFGIEPFATQMRHSNFKNYKYDWYWQKNSAAGFVNAKKRPLKVIENIMIFSKKPPRYNPQGLIRLDKKIQTKGDAKLKNKRGGTGHCTRAAKQPMNMCKNLPITQSIFCSLVICKKKIGAYTQLKSPSHYLSILLRLTPKMARRYLILRWAQAQQVWRVSTQGENLSALS